MTPVDVIRVDRVCVIKNPSVRKSFLEAYRNALEDREIDVRVLPRKNLRECPITSTYRATWSWDFALYMSYLEIKVFYGNRLVGKAEYDSTGGGFNLGKFISARKKVEELVDQLFAQNP